MSVRAVARGRTDLLVVLGVWAGLGIKFFLGNFLVSHDATQVLEIFHYFYNQLAAAGEPPQWLAFGLNSRAAGVMQLGAFTIVSYPVMIAGWLAGVRNAHTLFLVGMLLEQLLLLVGLHLLGRRVFANALTRVYVGIAAATTAYFWTQVLWNQRLYFLWPLVLLTLLRFFDTRRLADLWASLLCLVFLFFGGLYVAPLHMLVFLLFVIALLTFVPAWRRWPDWRTARAPLSLALFGGLLATVVSFLTLAWEGLGFTMSYTGGRTGAILTVPLDVFLSWGQPSLSHYLEFLFAVPYESDLNTTTYVGLVTLALVFYGIFRQRAPLYRALWVVTLVLVALSLANLTIVAPLVYYLFPPMRIFRHVGFVSVLAKLFVLLLAGYGLEAYLKDQAGAFRRLGQRVPSLGHVASALVLLIVALDLAVFQGEPPYRREWMDLTVLAFGPFHYIALATLLALILGLAVARRRSAAFRGRLVLAAAAFELLSYQTGLFYALPVRDHPSLAGVWMTRPPTLQTVRLETRDGHPHAPYAQALLGRFGATFPELDGFLELDSCRLELRRDLVNLGVDRLMRARRGLPLDVPLPPPAIEPAPTDAALWRALGCGGPTLRVYREVRIAPTVDQAAALVGSRHDIDEVPVLHGATPPGSAAAPYTVETAVIRVARHSANETLLEVLAPGGAWLLVKQPFHPYWRATVNGSEREIWEANLAFMAIALDRGPNAVRFYYDDDASLMATVWIALVSCAATGAVVVATVGVGGAAGTPRGS